MMEQQPHLSKKGYLFAALGVTALLLTALFMRAGQQRRTQEYNSLGMAMDTIVSQTAYGPNAQAGMQQVGAMLLQLQDKLSLYEPDSQIAAINASSGAAPQPVDEQTLALLRQALTLSARSDGAFQITVAPLTLLWNITGENPQVPEQTEIAALLPLVDDSTVILDEAAGTVFLPQTGQALDLGGIAKGYACEAAKAVYEAVGVENALLSLGGNVYARGTRPDGTPFRIGFRDPNGDENSYVVSFSLQDQVIAVSGGYERWFEADGVRYCHILDAATGWPVQSDIASVGVICTDGTQADFWSTTLYCWGKEKTLQWMKTNAHAEGVCVLLLDNEGTLYADAALQGDLRDESDGAVRIVLVEAS